MSNVPEQGSGSSPKPNLFYARQWFAALRADADPPLDSQGRKQYSDFMCNFLGGEYAHNGANLRIQERLAKLALLHELSDEANEYGIGDPRTFGEDIVRMTWLSADEENKKRHIAELASKDFLTGALNRRGGDEVITSWTRKKKSRGLLEFDVVNFKEVNEVLGKKIGDEVLKEVAYEIGDYARADDAFYVVRMGGDEFRLLVGDASESDFNGLRNRVLAAQYSKVSDETYTPKNRHTWVAIDTIKSNVSENGFRPIVKWEEEEGGKPSRRQLYIDDYRICPLRDLAPLSVGAAYGMVDSDAAFREIEYIAAKGCKTDGDKLHSIIGHVYRTRVRSLR
jgi:diguanylate cyclase (GGDEF)-like protein